MIKIENVTIIGMGALGMLFGSSMSDALGKEHVSFLMDKERYLRHSKDTYKINGKVVDFKLTTEERLGIQDLIIVGTKYSGLADAINEMTSIVGEDTIIISMMNGISSENDIAAKYGRDHVIDCCALGMDAMRTGTELTYSHMGRLQIGASKGEKTENVQALKEFFDRTNIPYELSDDITKTLWAKLQLNVGINQTCMVYNTDYGHALDEDSEAFQNMKAAMLEVSEVGAHEGVNLSEQVFQNNLSILRTLNPQGYPSMQQDRIAKRNSEVELFAGTIIKLGKKYGVPTPINQKYYDKIKEIELGYTTHI